MTTGQKGEVHIHTYIHTYTHTYTHTHTHIHTYTHTHIHTYTHTHMHTYTHTHIHTRTHTHIHTYTCLSFQEDISIGCYSFRFQIHHTSYIRAYKHTYCFHILTHTYPHTYVQNASTHTTLTSQVCGMYPYLIFPPTTNGMGTIHLGEVGDNRVAVPTMYSQHMTQVGADARNPASSVTPGIARMPAPTCTPPTHPTHPTHPTRTPSCHATLGTLFGPGWLMRSAYICGAHKNGSLNTL